MAVISIRESFDYIRNTKGNWKGMLSWFGIQAGNIAFSFAIQLLSIVPFLNIVVFCCIFPFYYLAIFAFSFFIMGYSLEIIETSQTNANIIPDVFADYKKRAIDGAKMYLITLVYSLPLSLVIFGIMFAWMIPLVALGEHF